MGEYANFMGRRIKIGTCEDMYYLRWDQRELVTESETPLFKESVVSQIRFRFPFPDEDHVLPGDFEDPFRGIRLDGFEQPAELEHGLVQFSAQNGYLVSLPCPEQTACRVTLGSDHKPAVFHKNGYGGPASLIQQAWRGGRLVGIAKCNGCGTPYRLEEGYEEAAAIAIRAHADAKMRDYELSKLHPPETFGDLKIAQFYHDAADRLLAGYRVGVGA